MTTNTEYVAYPGLNKAVLQGCTCKGYVAESDDILINLDCWVHMGTIKIGAETQKVLYLYDGVGNYDATHGLYDGPRMENMTVQDAWTISARGK